MSVGFRTILSQYQAGYLQAKGSYLDYRTKMKDCAIWFNRMLNLVEVYIWKVVAFYVAALDTGVVTFWVGYCILLLVNYYFVYWV